LTNTIKKKLQLLFKEISYGIFKLLYGKIDKIEDKDNFKIKKTTLDNNLNYNIYFVDDCRIYTDTINDTAIIKNNRIIEGPSFQIRSAKYDEISNNVVLLKGTPRVKKKIKGKIFSLLTGGAGNFNYWHWLFDVLPRLKILQNSFELNKIDYFLFPNIKKKFQYETLNILKIPIEKRLSSIESRHIEANQIISTDHPYVIKNDASNEIQNLPSWILFWLRETFLNEKNYQDNSFPKKIYIDRGDATSNHSKLRKIINENEIIEKLKIDNYDIIRLADFPFEQQVKMFFNAERIIGLHGAGFANLIFCKPNTEILEIKPSSDGKVIENLANKFNLKYKSISKVPKKFNHNNQQGHVEVEYQEIQKIFNI
tara:strand:+ start:315 stop:1418 length:1104 start_codon:yes stop_codon:yes gene_type:complete